MFEVRLMVEDKNLPKLLWKLDGLLAQQPVLLPVKNAKADKGKVVQAEEGEQSLCQRAMDMIRENMASQKVTTIDTDVMKEMVHLLGGDESKVNYLNKCLKLHKVIGAAKRQKGTRARVYKLADPSKWVKHKGVN